MSEFVPVAKAEQLKPEIIVSVFTGGRELALFLVDGQPYCTEDICTHEDCLLSDDGWVEGEEVECGCHGARFNIKTGAVTMPPAIDPLRTFPAEIRDGQVYIQLP